MSHISGRISETTSVNLASATSVERPAPISSGALEWDVLLAAGCVEARASDLGRIRGLLENAMEWEAVLRLAQDHGTSSLLYRNLSGLNGVIPSPVMASLRQRYEKNVHKSLFLARELMRILECLDGLGMEVIPYKGIVLSEAYYGDIALRQAGDMDLFVRNAMWCASKAHFAIWGTPHGWSYLRMLWKITSRRDMSGLSTVPPDRTCLNCSGLYSRVSTRSTSTWMHCLSVR